MTNTVTKVPAMQEDLGIGVGVTQQQRGSTTFSVTQIELNWIMRSTNEIRALDITKYTRVQLHQSGPTTQYWFDATSSAVDDGITVLEPDSAPSLGRWLLTSSGGGGGDDAIPLSGTVAGRPITGTLEFLTPNTNGSVTLSHQNNVLGNSDAFVFRANGADTGFFFVSKTPAGVDESFGFSANGALILPSIEDNNADIWEIGAGEILGLPNTLVFSAQNLLSGQVPRGIAFSVDTNTTFYVSPNGNMTAPRTTLGSDDAHSFVTKDYVDAAIPPGGGEANTMSSEGTGAGITLPKAAANLPIKSFIGGTDITITEQAETITINSTASGGTGGDFIPLSGTLPGAQITGDLVFAGSTTNCIFNGNSGVVFGADGSGLGDAYGIGYSDALKTLLITPNQLVPPVEPVGLTLGTWDGSNQQYANIQPSGRMTLDSHTIDSATDGAVLVLGWWKNDVLNAANVTFGGHVHASEFSAQGNINALGSVTVDVGQFYLNSTQGTAANVLTRRDFVEGNFLSTTKTTSQLVASKVTIDNDFGVVGQLDCLSNIVASGSIDSAGTIRTTASGHFEQAAGQSTNPDSLTKKDYVDFEMSTRVHCVANNSLISFGYIESNGAVSGGSGDFSCVRVGVGDYEIVFVHGASSTKSQATTANAVTLGNDIRDITMLSVNSTKVGIFVADEFGNGVDAPFEFIRMAR